MASNSSSTCRLSCSASILSLPNQNTYKKYRDDGKAASHRNRVLVYLALGVLVGGDCYLYSIGLLYLPVSTFSLICASQLAFNAFFSYFLNSQKLTPIILNSLLLLTISSTLLAFNNEESNFKKVTKAQYVTSFICTIGASAGYGLSLSLQQLAFSKVLKRQKFSEVMDMIIYVSVVASGVSVVGLFASGEWETLSSEMDSYKPGKVSYVMNLVWTAVTWQVFNLGSNCSSVPSCEASAPNSGIGENKLAKCSI